MADWNKKGYIVFCVIGLLLSVYAVYLEHAKAQDDDFVALCDIDESISCTSVLSSEYSVGFGIFGKLFGENSLLNIPSAYYGIIFYSFLFLISIFNSIALSYLRLLLSVVSLATSVFLMYILMFVIHKVCLVCYGIHITNMGLLVCVVHQLCCSVVKKPKRS